MQQLLLANRRNVAQSRSEVKIFADRPAELSTPCAAGPPAFQTVIWIHSINVTGCFLVASRLLLESGIWLNYTVRWTKRCAFCIWRMIRIIPL
jgi:hypothetical protein